MASVFEWTTTRQGKESVILDGYVYKKTSDTYTKDNSSLWICVKTKISVFENPKDFTSPIKTRACQGSIKLNATRKVVIKNNSARHFCKTQQKEAIIRKAQEKVRLLAGSSVSTPSAIFNKALMISPKSDRMIVFREKRNLQKIASRKKVSKRLYQEPSKLEKIKFTGKNYFQFRFNY